MAKAETLRSMLVAKIQYLYHIELELTEALPQLAGVASEPGLKEAFKNHLDETRGQVQRLEQIFSILGEKHEKLKGEAIKGLVKDTEWLEKNTVNGVPLDVAVIGAAQAVEAYEASEYATAAAWAEQLPNEQIATLLKQSGAEEVNAGTKLGNLGTQILARIKAN